MFRRYFLFGFFTLFSSAFVSQCFYYFLKTVLHQESSYSMLILISGIVLGNIFGVLGMLLSIPAAAILSFIYRDDYFLPRQERRRPQS